MAPDDKTSDNSLHLTNNDSMVVPCLVYQEQGDKIVSLIASWNTNTGTLDISQDQAFSVSKSEQNRFVVTWDGGNNFILPDACAPSVQYRSSTKLIPLTPIDKQEVFLGENIKLTKVNKPNGDMEKYTVEIKFDGKKTTKDIYLDMKYQNKSGKSYDLNPFDLSFAYFDGQYAYFTFVRPLDEETKFILVKYNLASDEKSLNIIASGNQLTPSALFLQNSVENIGGKFYSHTDDGLGFFDINQNKFIDLKNLSYNCWNFIPSTVDEEIYIKFLSVIGVYNDILIVSVPVKTGNNNEALYCAVKDEQIIAAVYIHDQIMKLMDANKNVKSEINLKELKINNSTPLAFPCKNGTNG